MMTINTDPDGALIYLNDQEVGRTPLKHDFQEYGNYQLEVRKEGYETLKSTQDVSAPWWDSVGPDLISELLPFHFQVHRDYHYSLVPASTQPADAQSLLQGAKQMQRMLLTSPNTRQPSTQPTH